MKGPNKNTNLYRFSHLDDLLLYSEDRSLSGPWWDDSDEWIAYKAWWSQNYGGY